MSGYTNCRCRDCFEIAISDDEAVPAFCWECEEAGCEEDSECQVDHLDECADCGESTAGPDEVHECRKEPT